MSKPKSNSFCVPFCQLEPAAIKKLHKAHPGALPISIEWMPHESGGVAVIWWVPAPEPAARSASEESGRRVGSDDMGGRLS
jgi:hypothetical protein